MIIKNNKSLKAILLACQRCGHNWKYHGTNRFVCSCPYCHTSVTMNKRNNRETNSNLQQDHTWIIYECPNNEHKEKCDRIFPLKNSGNVIECMCRCHKNIDNNKNLSIDKKSKDRGLI